MYTAMNFPKMLPKIVDRPSWQCFCSVEELYLSLTDDLMILTQHNLCNKEVIQICDQALAKSELAAREIKDFRDRHYQFEALGIGSKVA